MRSATGAKVGQANVSIVRCVRIYSKTSNFLLMLVLIEKKIFISDDLRFDLRFDTGDLNLC